MAISTIDTDPPLEVQPAWCAGAGKWRAFWQGSRAMMQIPGLVLFSTALGFGAYARDSGLSLGQTAFVSVTVFALPGQVVMVDQIARGAALAAIAFAVMLTAIRLLPMVVVFVPYIRDENAAKGPLLLASHFVAVTAWVLGMAILPRLPVRLRLAHHFGVGTALLVAITVAAMIGHQLAAAVPPALAGALLFLTPIYFLLSLLGAVTVKADQLAIGFGLVLGAPVYLLIPDFDLLGTGLIGGSLAYGIARFCAPPNSQADERQLDESTQVLSQGQPEQGQPKKSKPKKSKPEHDEPPGQDKPGRRS